MTREEAIKWIDDRMCFGRGAFTEHHPPNIDECWQAGMMAIEALKVRPQGEWKIEESKCIYGKKFILTCSICGDSVSVTEASLSHEKYCRNCGADMRGEKNGDK